MYRKHALVLGDTVTCEDGTRGELGSLLVDATTLRLTGVVVGGAVEPPRLVPFALVSGLREHALDISCTAASIKGLEPAEPGKVIDVADETAGALPVSVVYESDSSAKTFLRPRERVMTLEGAVGRVHGCRIDVGDHPGQLAGLLVDVGHLGEEHVVEVPTRAITSMKGLVVLDMTKQTARELPTVEV